MLRIYMIFAITMSSMAHVVFAGFGEIKVKEMNLLREVCGNMQLNFCSDGIYDGHFREFPCFISYNEENLFAGYNDTLYMLPSLEISKLLSVNGIDYTKPWVLDRMFDVDGLSADTLSYKTSLRYKRKVNRYLKKLKINRKFNGLFYYVLYKMRFSYFYWGKVDLYLPDMKNGGMRKNSVHTCFITKIMNIGN